MLILVGCSIALLFAVGSDFVDHSIMSSHSWIVLGIETSFFAFMCLLLLLPLSYINRQTQYQIERLLFLREVYSPFIRDERFLRAR